MIKTNECKCERSLPTKSIESKLSKTNQNAFRFLRLNCLEVKEITAIKNKWRNQLDNHA